MLRVPVSLKTGGLTVVSKLRATPSGGSTSIRWSWLGATGPSTLARSMPASDIVPPTADARQAPVHDAHEAETSKMGRVTPH